MNLDGSIFFGFSNSTKMCVIFQVEKLEDGTPGRYKVTMKNTETGEEVVDEFNTVCAFL